MKEYEEKFIWSKFLNKLKEDFVKKINKNIEDMLIDSSDEDNIDGNNMMPNYISLYNETFFDDNDMILDD